MCGLYDLRWVIIIKFQLLFDNFDVLNFKLVVNLVRVVSGIGLENQINDKI
jgi:hypothetical protein